MNDINKVQINIKEQGSVSILSLLVMMLLLAIGGAMITVSSAEVRTAAGFRDGVAAQYVAEAGAKRALYELSTNNGSLSAAITDQPIGPSLPGTYTVSIEQQGINRVITATGKVNNATRQVVMEVIPETPYDFVIYSGNDLTLGLNSINGSVGSNGNINFTALTWVYGDAIAHGKVTHPRFDFNYIRGKEVSNAPALAIPSFSKATFQKNGYAPTISGGEWQGPGNLNNNIYFYDGDLEISSDITGPGIIYATGTITTHGHGIFFLSTTNISNNVILISEKNIIALLNVSIDNSALVAKNDITFAISDFNGSAVAGGTISTPLNFMAHPSSKSNWNVTKNPFIPQPTLWQPERVKVGYWDNQKLN